MTKADPGTRAPSPWTGHLEIVLVEPGGHLRRTVDDLAYPVIVMLTSPSEEAVMRDIGTIRYLDGRAFYDVEPTAAINSPQRVH